MLSLTVTDHVCLDSQHVAQNYMVHARAAERLVALTRTIRIVLVSLLIIATAASVADLLFNSRIDQITAIIADTAALAGFVLYIILGFEGRIHAHRMLAQRLWLVSERYRALVAEIEDGFLDRSALLSRRDDLIHQLHAVYESGFSVDQPGYETSRLSTLTDGHHATGAAVAATDRPAAEVGSAESVSH
jgi:hypothetical protein